MYSNSLDFDLVSNDYYEKDLKYQDKIDQINRANLLEKKFEINQINGDLEFVFPTVNHYGISGTIEFFRPSDDDLDKNINFNLDSGNVFLYKNRDIKSGLWIIKVPWVHNDSSYFYQEEIMIR